MDNHVCQIEYRDYTSWSFTPKLENVNPIEHKLFHGDEVQVASDNTISIVNSPVRNQPHIAGILLLEHNRTYGRTTNKKRLYYKCRPHDTKLPNFLIPYDIPMGFNKNFKNKYVTFQFVRWNEKHPHGILSQNLGDVHDFPSYCEYVLYCKQLHESITKSITHTKQGLKAKSADQFMGDILKNTEQYGSFLKRDQDNIFSIDPEGCVDRDDAMSIFMTKKTTEMTRYKVSVYIANVWVWIHALGLWDFIGERVSTIYFPTAKRPMLPTALGEQLCSLDQLHRRFGFVMDFIVVEDSKKGIYIQDNQLKGPCLTQCTLTVKNNYDYEEPPLLQNKDYQQLLSITKKLDSNVIDSHHVVEYWMTQMNRFTAKKMKKHQIGIYRVVSSRVVPTANIPENAPMFVKILEQQLSGTYKRFDRDEEYVHETLGVTEYVHFTSPIRRMVDLLNQISWVLHVVTPSNIPPQVGVFYKKQMLALDSLNTKMKQIRRIQSDCDILFKVHNDDALIQKTYEGMVVTIGESKCSLYIEELKWLAQIPFQDCYRKYMKLKCKLYVFEKEEQMKRKIRVHVIADEPKNDCDKVVS